MPVGSGRMLGGPDQPHDESIKDAKRVIRRYEWGHAEMEIRLELPPKIRCYGEKVKQPL